MPAQSCTVSFLDPDGIRHAARVQAESLYEAAVHAVKTFRDHGCPPAPASPLMIEVQPPPVVHTLTLMKVEQWLAGSAKSPSDRVTKDRLKELLAR